ncbi:GtrA family protein [Alkalibacterium pelagium]|uniref:Putative flippase GtrA (Transmembrane translocase of bactoprenol-linked glucose) n=1 Tax=Alkalibacterium pelagium TaxID=426702 RepID=A0A1H7HK95_9LACT|nr:GtrA family protein [Alkalibacterium pelagium]GEN50430.1 hypothetical protein APE02nite_10950 [Alkalibacterium pelagium]SEK50067.1 Putative flippase GtrA (transmembrane translocase of bactoprenol-linked glucose) [Alkalibacterium pelagium]
MMKKVYGKFHQFIDYFLFGVITASLNIILFYTFNQKIGLHYLLSNAIAITLAILFSYIVNKKFVFHTKMTTKRAVAREMFLFMSMRATAAVMDMAGLYILVQFIRLGATLSKVIIETLIATSNYFVSKRIIFKNEGSL